MRDVVERIEWLLGVGGCSVLRSKSAVLLDIGCGTGGNGSGSSRRNGASFLRERLGNSNRLGHGRKRSAWMSHGRLGRWLGSGLWLLTLAVDILFSFIQVESSKLDGSSIHLAVAGHTDSLFLVQHSSLEA